MGSGSNYVAPTANTWATGWYFSVAGVNKPVSVLNSTWQITGVQLEIGTASTAFETRPFTTELQLCQRYYYALSVAIINYPAFHYGSSAYTGILLPVPMRATPTVTSTGQGTQFYEAGSVLTFAVSNWSGQSNQIVSLQGSVTGGTSGYAGTFYPMFQANAEIA
jgi:hypothetical protein